jgi:phosphoribosylglycinamide formyltransferase-1
MNNLAIFASGSGTNAEQIMRYFSQHDSIRVSLVLSNKPDAKVLERARNHSVPSQVFNRENFYNSELIISKLHDYKINFIVLAGFLWLVPENILTAYAGRIINIHPALLPAYGGKGMYGDRVHAAVIQNKEKESGITIHMVNREYDKGDILFQARCAVQDGDTPASLAARIHELEYRYFPEVIERTVLSIPQK